MIRAARGGPVAVWHRRRGAPELLPRREVRSIAVRRESGRVVVTLLVRGGDGASYPEAMFHAMVWSPAHDGPPGSRDIWPPVGHPFRVPREVWIAFVYDRVRLEREIAEDLAMLKATASDG